MVGLCYCTKCEAERLRGRHSNAKGEKENGSRRHEKGGAFITSVRCVPSQDRILFKQTSKMQVGIYIEDYCPVSGDTLGTPFYG